MERDKIRWFVFTALVLIASCLFLKYFLIGAPNQNATSVIIAYLLINLLAIFLLIRKDFRAYQWIGFSICLGLQLWFLWLKFIPPAKLYAACGCNSAKGCEQGCISMRWEMIGYLALATLAITYALRQRHMVKTAHIILMITGVVITLVFLFPLYYTNNGFVITVFKYLADHQTTKHFIFPWSEMVEELTMIIIWLAATLIVFLPGPERQKNTVSRIIWIVPIIGLGMSVEGLILTAKLYPYYASRLITSLIISIIIFFQSAILIIYPKDVSTRQRIALLLGIGGELLLFLLLCIIVIAPSDEGKSGWYANAGWYGMVLYKLELLSVFTFIAVVVVGWADPLINKIFHNPNLKKEIAEKYRKIYEGIPGMRKS